MNILVNLSDAFFQRAELADLFDRLDRLGTVRKTRHFEERGLAAELPWAEALLMGSWPPLTEELLDRAPGLKFRGHLDLTQEAARLALTRGVPVSISRHGYSPPVSEMALGLILGTLRHISDYHAAMRDGSERWFKQFPKDVDPLERELTGRSVGLVGFGRVGRRLAELLVPFHCEIRVFDPYVPAEALAPLSARASSLDDLIRESEVVVICAASNPGTRRLVAKEQLALFRENAVLVNVARAALVDTEALVERLRQGRFFAAVDVFDEEPLALSSVLRTLPNAYLTPHRAGGLVSSARRILGYLVDDLEAVLAGRPQSCPLTATMIPSLDA